MSDEQLDVKSLKVSGKSYVREMEGNRLIAADRVIRLLTDLKEELSKRGLPVSGLKAAVSDDSGR
jgi:hypothetical protein